MCLCLVKKPENEQNVDRFYQPVTVKCHLWPLTTKPNHIYVVKSTRENKFENNNNILNTWYLQSQWKPWRRNKNTLIKFQHTHTHTWHSELRNVTIVMAVPAATHNGRNHAYTCPGGCGVTHTQASPKDTTHTLHLIQRCSGFTFRPEPILPCHRSGLFFISTE